uniref:FYVE, RhoGEF and PH domain-containing protein 1-like isoform X2 n=1 Tax=Myxine glutinosa TaxID=7769 RepID=UPI00358E6076
MELVRTVRFGGSGPRQGLWLRGPAAPDVRFFCLVGASEPSPCDVKLMVVTGSAVSRATVVPDVTPRILDAEALHLPNALPKRTFSPRRHDHTQAGVEGAAGLIGSLGERTSEMGQPECRLQHDLPSPKNDAVSNTQTDASQLQTTRAGNEEKSSQFGASYGRLKPKFGLKDEPFGQTLVDSTPCAESKCASFFTTTPSKPSGTVSECRKVHKLTPTKKTPPIAAHLSFLVYSQTSKATLQASCPDNKLESKKCRKRLGHDVCSGHIVEGSQTCGDRRFRKSRLAASEARLRPHYGAGGFSRPSVMTLVTMFQGDTTEPLTADISDEMNVDPCKTLNFSEIDDGTIEEDENIIVEILPVLTPTERIVNDERDFQSLEQRQDCKPVKPLSGPSPERLDGSLSQREQPLREDAPSTELEDTLHGGRASSVVDNAQHGDAPQMQNGQQRAAGSLLEDAQERVSLDHLLKQEQQVNDSSIPLKVDLQDEETEKLQQKDEATSLLHDEQCEDGESCATADGTTDFDQQNLHEPITPKLDVQEKLFLIADELLHTEEAYVQRLNLLHKVFYADLLEEAREKGLYPVETVIGIFSNISSIHSLHQDFLLPQLESRMQHWNETPRIGDILQNLAPFLKLYGEYVKNFDRAMGLVNTWLERSSSFKATIQRIQKQRECGSLTLQHHMLGPVQRIPRYELLLRQYLKHLPAGAPDHTDACKAMEIISKAADHSNVAIKKMEKERKLLDVYEMIGGEEDIVHPSNELLKEGPILKLSARNGTRMERHLFLFRNMLLYCVPKLRLKGQKFTVRTRLDVDGMRVTDLNNDGRVTTFQVSGTQRVLELCGRTAKEKEEWVEAIQEAIQSHAEKRKTFQEFRKDEELPVWQLGQRAPVWVRDANVTMCRVCHEFFHPLTRRRHHCRACGHVVCWKCSENKLELEYDPGRLSRICLDCFGLLTAGGNASVGVATRGKGSGILEREGSVVSMNSFICGFLYIMEKGVRPWQRAWFALPRTEPLVLYMFRAPQDAKAWASLPLPGYKVHTLGASEDVDMRRTFRMTQSSRELVFAAASEHEAERWVHFLTAAAQAELDPDPDAAHVFDIPDTDTKDNGKHPSAQRSTSLPLELGVNPNNSSSPHQASLGVKSFSGQDFGTGDVTGIAEATDLMKKVCVEEAAQS